MWCPNCQADVAAEVSPDNRRISCASCRTELGTTAPEGEARNLLDRWSKEDPLEDPLAQTGGPISQSPQPPQNSPNNPPQRPTPQRPTSQTPPPNFGTNQNLGSNQGETGQPGTPFSQSAFGQPPQPSEGSPVSPAQGHSNPPVRKPKFRIDGAHELGGSAIPREPDHRPHGKPAENSGQHQERVGAGGPLYASFQPPAQPPAPPNGGNSQEPEGYRQFHPAHPTTMAGPHFEIQAAMFQNQAKKTNWISVIGQMLAYGGVVLLTIGTSMVLGGYFGGPEKYTPTGWLITTVGQMLLFLGVVTLVSSGMEQTSDEVTQRVEILGTHILRIEEAQQHALKGPHFARQGAPAQHHYADLNQSGEQPKQREQE